MFPPPPSHPAYELLAERAKLAAERDLSFRSWLQESWNKVPGFVLTRIEGGTQFPISDLLRHYFLECASRLANHGPHSFPSTFNVIESFLRYSHDYFLFDLRSERDHLLRLGDYIEWYTSGTFPEKPEILTDVADEGVIYSYSLVGPTDDFKVECAVSDLVVSGVAMVRHSTELSMMVLCGDPAPIPEEEIPDYDSTTPFVGREGLDKDPSLSVDDRYLKDLPEFSRVVGLVRFDLETRRFFVRYVCQDIGYGYLIASDDPTTIPSDVAESQKANILTASANKLRRYEPLFALLSSLMYLPVFFVEQHDRVIETTFATGLQARRKSLEVRKALRNLDRGGVHFQRTVACLLCDADEARQYENTVVPPDLELATSGFWKPLAPAEIGEDEHGNPIVGKTWVERTETWSSHGFDEFVVRKAVGKIRGAKPGYLYIARSGSHGPDLYKIGKTERTPLERARELTAATGVPTPFEVLARWEVGDVDEVESEVHRRLRSYRVNRRREFFRAPLPTIVAEVARVVEESMSMGSSETDTY